MTTEQEKSDREFGVTISGAMSRIGVTVILTVGMILSVLAGCCGFAKVCRTSEEGGQEFHQVVQGVKSGVAYFDVRTDDPGLSATGTAFLLSNTGLVVTCWHTLYDTANHMGRKGVPDTDQIYLNFDTHGRIYKAEVLHHSQAKDVALLRINLTQAKCDSFRLNPVVLGTVDLVHEGEDVACTGYDLSQTWKRFGRKYHWLTTHRGIISCVFTIGPSSKEHYLDRFQIDALVNKGASGGPVYLAESGVVVGMVQSFKGKERDGLVVNYGLANCTPVWKILKTVTEWRASATESDEGDG